MSDLDVNNGPEPDRQEPGASVEANADADQAGVIHKLARSDAVHISDGPSEAVRSILQPEDRSRIQASITRSEQGGDDSSVGAPSTFSTGLNVRLTSCRTEWATH